MIIKAGSRFRKPTRLLWWGNRGLSIDQARRVMSVESYEVVTNEILKKRYLEKAKIYHPDSGKEGSDEKFKKLQQAYEVLSKLPEHQRTDQQKKYEEFFKRKYSHNPEEFTDEQRRQEYERWKKETFSEYNQKQHEEFLKQRYRNNQHSHSDFSQNRDHFHSSGHFYGYDDNGEDLREHIPKKRTFKTNSRFVAFFLSSEYRSRVIWRYREEIICFMICFAIFFNMIVYYRAMTRRDSPYADRRPINQVKPIPYNKFKE
ncbi:unnamed protein product [Moneuplotes crassus]|uniref:J domain-containing protein n=1 Tax=Euplotes crassus TaxID=5936 RepID=A0AAD1XUF7_EUPCR|nr:unnamed protein product [Moneuplotes crassus]